MNRAESDTTKEIQDLEQNREEYLLAVEEEQKKAVVREILLVVAYVLILICLGVFHKSCAADIPVAVIYTIEIVTCCSLLIHFESRLRKRYHSLQEEMSRTKAGRAEEIR